MTPSIKILKDPSGARRIIAKENDEVIIDAYLAPGVTFGNEGLIKRWGPGVSIEHLRQNVRDVRQHTELNALEITKPAEDGDCGVDDPDVRCRMYNCKRCREKPRI